MAAKTKVWKGAAALEPLLRPIDKLTPHPQNPRRGSIDDIAASLERFGQVRVILVDEKGQIVAGNHTHAAARKLGWTHVAANLNTFESPEAARDYLLADNRLSDLGEYERAELLVLVEELETTGQWAGTGYVPDDLAHLRSMQKIAAPVAPEPASAPPMPPPALRELVLLFTEERLGAISGNLRVLRERYQLEGVTETVLRAVKLEALRLNQGEGQ